MFTHGSPEGAPGWAEDRKDGTRVSSEYFHDKGKKGLTRMYHNNEEKINVISTTNKQLAPGWLKAIINNKGTQGLHSKGFLPAGNIVEAVLDENGKPIKGIEWKLKENGTHGKYSQEIVVRKMEGSN